MAMAEAQNRWAMVVDLDVCTGCQACVVACHAENNVPFVGEIEVTRGRVMHWMRIERYWEGEGQDLRAQFIPMLCQHCQKAPCEPVCPMYAVVHGADDLLNMQIYNRCIGTRLCALACPWKVRQFNWFEPHIAPPLNEYLNPDVTQRRRGLMEKCSYCLQRIRRAKQDARANNVPLKDGDVVPACAQTCPTEALIFGDLNDPHSRVSQLERSGRSFKLLEELGTFPSGTYLKRGESNV
jgi:Fe-S-cluster-containing dehydrogenase component